MKTASSRRAPPSLRATRKSGFTIAEVMVASTAFVIIMAVVLSFLLHTANFSSYNQGKLLVNRDIRKFTSELSDHATYSNYFIVYDSFTNRERKDEGTSGDFLVLANVNKEDPTLFESLTGYYRSATADTEGPVRKFTIEFDPPSSEPIEDLLPAVATVGQHQEVIELSRGLSNGYLFYNFFNRSITVQGEILHQGSNNKQATNTYNFTISPRG